MKGQNDSSPCPDSDSQLASTAATSLRKIDFVFGTRPEAVKLSVPILRAKLDPRFQVRVISTGQHREMMRPLLDFFGVQPDLDLNLMQPGQDLASLLSRSVQELQKVWQQARPDLVCVQGDTTTCAAAALAAFYMQIPVAHVEAGLRTGDLQSPFPEEFNRRLVALSASWHFAPTELAARNLRAEGILKERIWVTGNTGIDALLNVRDRLRADALWQDRIATKYPLIQRARNEGRKLLLLTMHRRESFGPKMQDVFRAAENLAAREDVVVVFPAHRNPAVQQALRDRGEAWSRVVVIEPMDYIEFVWLMDAAEFVMTDSGGVQEEAPSLNLPVMILRDETERQEAIDAQTAILVGTRREAIERQASQWLDHPETCEAFRHRANPFGDGRASSRILNVLASPDSSQNSIDVNQTAGSLRSESHSTPASHIGVGSSAPS